MDTPNVIEAKVREVLAAAPALHLSTCADGVPWGAGAFFAELDTFTLTLVLESHGRTLTNIRSNPRVAVVVSSSNPMDAFLQASAEVEVLDDLAETREALLAKVPQAAAFFDAPIHAVKLHVTKWKATDILNGWLPGKELTAPDAGAAGAAGTELRGQVSAVVSSGAAAEAPTA